MSTTPILSTIQTLLPTTNLIPPSLISLTTSLLAQSRSKAPRLRQEEEIARIYVVSYIAITQYNKQRSRNGGNTGRGDGGGVVEMGKVMPPCSKKVFERLRGWFEGMLVLDQRVVGDQRVVVDGGTSKGRGLKRGVGDGEGREVEGSGKRGRRRVVREGTPVTAGAGRVKTVGSGRREKRRDIPGWVSPVIRMLCESIEVKKAIPHVFVGVETLFTAEMVEEEDLLVAIFVVVMWTLSRMKGWDGDEEIAEDNMDELITKLREWNASVDRKGKIKDMPRLDEQQVVSRIGQINDQAVKDEWLQMEWYLNIPGSEGNEDEDVIGSPTKKFTAKTPLGRKEKRAKYSAEGEEVPGAAGLLPGLGTMFQPALDWLSEDRRADLAQWKKQTLKEIARLESIKT